MGSDTREWNDVETRARAERLVGVAFSVCVCVWGCVCVCVCMCLCVHRYATKHYGCRIPGSIALWSQVWCV